MAGAHSHIPRKSLLHAGLWGSWTAAPLDGGPSGAGVLRLMGQSPRVLGATPARGTLVSLL